MPRIWIFLSVICQTKMVNSPTWHWPREWSGSFDLGKVLDFLLQPPYQMCLFVLQDLLSLMTQISCKPYTTTVLLSKSQTNYSGILEGVLSATSGAIVPEKSFWYQIDFTWNGGNWRYKTIAESPGSLSVRDISGFSRTLTRFEPFQTAKTLRIFLTPDGNMEQFNRKG
jgi:hypothetical protein